MVAVMAVKQEKLGAMDCALLRGPSEEPAVWPAVLAASVGMRAPGVAARNQADIFRCGWRQRPALLHPQARSVCLCAQVGTHGTPPDYSIGADHNISRAEDAAALLWWRQTSPARCSHPTQSRIQSRQAVRVGG